METAKEKWKRIEPIMRPVKQRGRETDLETGCQMQGHMTLNTAGCFEMHQIIFHNGLLERTFHKYLKIVSVVEFWIVFTYVFPIGQPKLSAD